MYNFVDILRQIVDYSIMIDHGPLRRTRLINQLFGTRLKNARRIRSLTQAELASKLGVSRVTVANLESGDQNIQLHQVFAIAEALDLRVENLLPSRIDLEREEIELGRVRSDLLENSDLLFLSLVNDQLLSTQGSEDEIESEIPSSDRTIRKLTYK
jgi:transcriptional regulator with XRE-family HTH domain